MMLLLGTILHSLTSLILLVNDQGIVIRGLSKYGYFAILFAAFWEGEVVLIAAGALCGAGYLDWRLTIVAAAIGGFSGGQGHFFFGAPRGPAADPKNKTIWKMGPPGETGLFWGGKVFPF